MSSELFNLGEVPPEKINEIKESDEYKTRLRKEFDKNMPAENHIEWLFENKDRIVNGILQDMLPVQDILIEDQQKKISELERYLKSDEGKKDFFRNKKEQQLIEERARLGKLKTKYTRDKTKEQLDITRANIAQTNKLKQELIVLMNNLHANRNNMTPNQVKELEAEINDRRIELNARHF